MKGSAAKMLFWASRRKVSNDSFTMYFLLLDWWFVWRAKRSLGGGGIQDYIIFLECLLPPHSAQSTDPLPSLWCVMFDSTSCSAHTSCRVGLESAECIWGGGLPRRSSVCLEACTAPLLADFHLTLLWFVLPPWRGAQPRYFSGATLASWLNRVYFLRVCVYVLVLGKQMQLWELFSYFFYCHWQGLKPFEILPCWLVLCKKWGGRNQRLPNGKG